MTTATDIRFNKYEWNKRVEIQNNRKTSKGFSYNAINLAKTQDRPMFILYNVRVPFGGDIDDRFVPNKAKIQVSLPKGAYRDHFVSSDKYYLQQAIDNSERHWPGKALTPAQIRDYYTPCVCPGKEKSNSPGEFFDDTINLSVPAFDDMKAKINITVDGKPTSNIKDIKKGSTANIMVELQPYWYSMKLFGVKYKAVCIDATSAVSYDSYSIPADPTVPVSTNDDDLDDALNNMPMPPASGILYEHDEGSKEAVAATAAAVAEAVDATDTEGAERGKKRQRT